MLASTFVSVMIIYGIYALKSTDKSQNARFCLEDENIRKHRQNIKITYSIGSIMLYGTKWWKKSGFTNIQTSDRDK